MGTFISNGVWTHLTKAASLRRRADVAVAYFGKGGSKLLPLRTGSRLVVNASEQAIKTGQTHPDDLLVLVKRGVAVYSVRNLHAKVYAFGTKAIIGSANVSGNSSDNLVEAVVSTTERSVVQQAHEFVRRLCRQQLTPELLKALQKLYRPPKFPRGGRRTRGNKSLAGTAELARLHVVQLTRITLSEDETRIDEEGMQTAKKRRQHPRGCNLDSFRWNGKDRFHIGDMVIQVTAEDRGRKLVDPPGNIIGLRRYLRGPRHHAFVYVEWPSTKRRPVKQLKKRLGKKAASQLQRNGRVRNRDVVDALLGLWA